MSQPTPAIVAQEAVRRLPRTALLLLCAVYVLSGFVGRVPWKSGDMASFGYMRALVEGNSPWLNPHLLGQLPEIQALLPYWLGAWAMQALPWLEPDLAARLPFMGLLGLTMASTWYAVYFLARAPLAQPVSFAFGGEANPKDYARAIADGALLALLACMGLAQLGHETTPALAQLAFSATTFLGLAALRWRPLTGRLALVAGLPGLALSGSPAMAVLFTLGAAAVQWRNRDADAEATQHSFPIAWMLGLTLLSGLLALVLDQWQWRISWPDPNWPKWRSILRFWLWFGWPAWPLALWTLWRWRQRLWNRHLALPLWLCTVCLAASVTSGGDRALLLALPALAALAAFALPTLSRSLSALIDWFTLLFFSFLALSAWVLWIAVHTGVPKQPAANIARLYPGFLQADSALALVLAASATVAWLWLVRWRTGRHRAALWKSLVLPASGTVLLWLLMTTLGLPLMNYTRSYVPLTRQLQAAVGPAPCIEQHGLTRAQIAAFQFHGGFELHNAQRQPRCDALLVNAQTQATLLQSVDLGRWRWQESVRRPADDAEVILVYKRVP